jgi:hypothetical protein
MRAVKGFRKESNHTMTSLDSVISSLLQRKQCIIALISPGSIHAAGDRGGILGDLIDFSATFWSLRAVNGTQEENKSCDDLT